MNDSLTCFISAPFDVDTSSLRNLLAERGVECSDLYDFSIGQSIQQILKRKLRQADVAIFVISPNQANILFEMGVCEGLGKPYYILYDEALKVPFYIENLIQQTSFTNREQLTLTLDQVFADFKKQGKKSSIRVKSEKDVLKLYDHFILDNLRSYIPQIKEMRKSGGNGKMLEVIVEDIFRTLRLNYVENTNQGRGADFAIWNKDLDKVLGNPILVQVKFGSFVGDSRLDNAILQLKEYVEKGNAKVGLLLYLDRENKRHTCQSELAPLIICYDLEDFVNDLLTGSFERFILSQRNKIAHGVE